MKHHYPNTGRWLALDLSAQAKPSTPSPSAAADTLNDALARARPTTTNAAARRPSGSSAASLGEFDQQLLLPDPAVWACLLGLFTEADVWETGLVSEQTAVRIIADQQIPLAEEVWQDTLLNHIDRRTARSGRGKELGSGDGNQRSIRYADLTQELEALHAKTLKHLRIEAVYASITVRAAAAFSDRLRALPQETLLDPERLAVAVTALLREPPVDLPEYLISTAVDLGRDAGGVLRAELLLNTLAKSVEKDPFGWLRSALQAKYGRLRDAFLALCNLGGGSARRRGPGGEALISMQQMRTALTQMGMGNLSRAEVERIITHADADGSGGIDYKEFVAMFSKSIAAIRERKAVLALQHQLPAQQHRSAADAAASPQRLAGPLSWDELDGAEQEMLRQLTECSWSLGDAFRALDKDGAGFIPSAELRGRLQQVGIELCVSDMQRIIAKVDANNDGQISFKEFVRRYRLHEVQSAAEAKADTVLALSAAYSSPLQAFEAACGGATLLTRKRLKQFVRSLGLHLTADAIQELCSTLDAPAAAAAASPPCSRSSLSPAAQSPTLGSKPADAYVSFFEFLRLFGLDTAGMTECTASSQDLMVHLEQALRVRIRACYGTMQTAFKAIDRDSNGVITPEELRAALTSPPLNLGFDAATIALIVRRADTDNNGDIDFVEFSQMFSYGRLHDHRRRQRQLRRQASLSSTRALTAPRAPAEPLVPAALDRFWTLLQTHLADLNLAFLFLSSCSDLHLAADGAVPAPDAARAAHAAAKHDSLSEPAFLQGVACLELLHRLRAAAPANAAGPPATRKSWPGGSASLRGPAIFRGARTRVSLQAGGALLPECPRLLAVLAGCPASIPAGVRAKLVELVLQCPHQTALGILQQAERARKHTDAGEGVAWPELSLDDDVDDGLERSIAGPQAVSIFRHLDHDSTGTVTQASLVRGLSGWLTAGSRGAILHGDPPSGMRVCAYLTDVEGNLDYLERFVAVSTVLAWTDESKTRLRFQRDDAVFVFGGDTQDKGIGDVRCVRLLLALKEDFPERVVLLIGNRDCNKLRLTSELSADCLVDAAVRTDASFPYWLPDSKRVTPQMFLDSNPEDNGGSDNTAANRLRWILKVTPVLVLCSAQRSHRPVQSTKP